MSRRAIRKKLSRKFQVGDVVTWGYAVTAHRVTEVTSRGLWVDSTSTGFGERKEGDRLWTFVTFTREDCHWKSPPRHTDRKPDVDAPPYAARQILEKQR